MKPALLVIDVQKMFEPYIADGDKKLAPEMMNWAIAMFRARQLPVLRVYHRDPQWGLEVGSPAFEFFDSIRVTADDPMIVKDYPNGFKKTDLKARLDGLGCDTVFLCGFSATGCVLATYHGAKDLDYTAILVKGALLSDNASQTSWVEQICDAVNVNVLKTMLN
jgi:nicotinamidase-related amidase